MIDEESNTNVERQVSLDVQYQSSTSCSNTNNITFEDSYIYVVDSRERREERRDGVREVTGTCMLP